MKVKNLFKLSLLILLSLKIFLTYNLQAELKSQNNFPILSKKKILLAKKGKKKRKKSKKVKDSTEVTFGETDISGERKAPMSTTIKGKSQTIDTDYDFVDIRKNWHKEMIQSTKSLNYSPYKN